jgi:hypothetical protein
MGYVACMEVTVNVYKILAGKPEGKRSHRTPRGRLRIILKEIFKKQGWRVCAGCIWLRIGTGARIV